MPAANETIKPIDRRTAPEIINSIQKRLKTGNSKQLSILEDILILDKLAQRQNPAGIMAFPKTNEYIQAVGQNKGVKAILKEVSPKAVSEEQKENLRRLSLLLGLVEIKKPNGRKIQNLSLKQRAVLGLGALSSILSLPGDHRNPAQTARELPQPVPIATSAHTTSNIPTITPELQLPPQAPLLDSAKSPTTEVLDTAPQISSVTENLTPPTGVELIPHSIRALQNPELNRLYQQGCIDFQEATIAGKKVVVLDYLPKPSIKCDIKFPQAYVAGPVKDRLRTYTQIDNNNLGITLEQLNANCFIYAATIASLMVTQNHQETPIIINPLLIGEADKTLTPEAFKKIQTELLNDPSYSRTYPPYLLKEFAQTQPINEGIQLSRDNTEKVLFSVLGATIRQSNQMGYLPAMESDGKTVSFSKDLFNQDEWKELNSQYKLTIKDNKVISSKAASGQIYSRFLENWYKNLKLDAQKQNKEATVLLGLRFHESEIYHSFAVIGFEHKNGRGYFRVTEGTQGDISPYLKEKGVIVNQDRTLSIPTDKIWEIGTSNTYIVSADKPSQQENSPAKENSEQRSSDMIGFRVNDAESIRALPPHVSTIRIAGNLSEVGENGQFKDPTVIEMLQAAKEKNLKIIFVYNPPWFPGIPEPQVRLNPWTWKEVEKDIEKHGPEIRSQIRKQLLAILNYGNVTLEIGNEPNENSTRHPHPFWRGEFKTFLKFFEWTALEANDIVNTQKLLNPNRPEVKLLAPALTHMEDQTQNYKDMESLLKQLDSRIKLPIGVAMHTYDLESFKFQLNLISKIFGDRRVIVTEANSDASKSGNLQELKAMLDFAQKNMLPFMVHEFKADPAFANQKDYAFGGLFVITPNDQKYNMLIEQLSALANNQQQLASNPPARTN